MANTKPALQAQITITEDVNDGISVFVDGGLDEFVVAAGTYDDIHALITQVQSEFDAHSEGSTFTVSVSDEGIVTISATDSFDLRWKTGTNHGSDNDDDHIGSILGYVDTADTGEGTSHSATRQHQYGWYPHRYPTKMGPWKPQAVGGEPRRTLSGTANKKLHCAFHHTYEVAFAMIEPEYVFTAEATGSNANKDLEHVWKEAAQGDFVTWYPDASDTGTSYKCYLVNPYDWDGAVTRPFVDYKAYDFALKFREQES